MLEESFYVKNEDFLSKFVWLNRFFLLSLHQFFRYWGIVEAFEY